MLTFFAIFAEKKKIMVTESEFPVIKFSFQQYLIFYMKKAFLGRMWSHCILIDPKLFARLCNFFLFAANFVECGSQISGPELIDRKSFPNCGPRRNERSSSQGKFLFLFSCAWLHEFKLRAGCCGGTPQGFLFSQLNLVILFQLNSKLCHSIVDYFLSFLCMAVFVLTRALSLFW